MALFGNTRQAAMAAEILERRRPSAPAKLKPHLVADTMSEDHIAEYRKVAKEIGLSAQDMMVEEFRIFLAKHDIPVFNLQEVVSYMDELSDRDNPTKLGWHWCPVREKDSEVTMTFGRPSEVNYNRLENVKASDFYESHRYKEWIERQNFNARAGYISAEKTDWRTMRSPAYTRTLPLHALKKIALVEREFKSCQVVFLVTDFTTRPHTIVNPDPFLMAVIPNSAVPHGKGRFIIDVWDEPGFGIERMVRPG